MQIARALLLIGHPGNAPEEAADDGLTDPWIPPPTWETRMKSEVPDFGLAQS